MPAIGGAIYLDHSATTPVDPRVLSAMLPWFSERFGNPATLYGPGQEAKEAIEEARGHVADLIGADPAEVYFTSGGTEANNWAIKGVALSLRDSKDHVITCAIEHHAVLEPCHLQEELGFRVTVLPVDKDGLVDPEDLKKSITAKTALISIMHSNNEIGTIQPISEMARTAKEKGVLFHTDAVQSVGKVPVDMGEMGCDLLSISAHKIYGPKGVGALYVRSGLQLAPFFHGGGQERGMRAGTSNVPAIVGLGEAARIARGCMEEERERLRALRDKLISGILSRIDGVVLNGHAEKRLPNNANLCFEGVEGTAVVLSLAYPSSADVREVWLSTGSACTAGSLAPSHVLLALGHPPDLANGSVRFTLGRGNTEEEIDYLLEILPPMVARIRQVPDQFKRRPV